MNAIRRCFLLAAACLASGALTGVHAEDKPAEKKDKKPPKSIHAFTVKDIDGKAVALSKYRDQVLLIVNVASQ